jgi:hypothetical protein
MILMRLVVGTLEYVSVISNDANLRSQLMGITFRSVINWMEFLMLNVFGRGIDASSLAVLYAGTFVQLTVGLKGHPPLCSFIRPLMVGGLEFKLIYFH